MEEGEKEVEKEAKGGYNDQGGWESFEWAKITVIERIKGLNRTGNV